ncbi:MAG: DegV family protein [Gemmatimonadales bacterium]|nr:DegV family protein [Gemmatimonadales bacterium]
MGVAIGYLDGPRLRRSLLAAAQWVGAGREELNRINVFPVPDGDTGTNFWLTMRSIADALRRLGDAPLPEVSRAAAQAAVMGSRGNSGMMLSHFLLGFDEGIGARFRIRARELAAAIRSGSERLQSALENPVEGTILTVCREAAVGAEQAAEAGHDVGGVVRGTLSHAEQALERTPELLAVLKEAGVVDAGGKGFVLMIEGVVRLIDGHLEEEAATDAQAFATPAPAGLAVVAADQDFRFCTEVLVRGDRLPSSTEARAAVHELGGSVQVVRTPDLLRVHVHMDDPEPLYRMAEGWGEVLTRKAEDMREQHRMLATVSRAVSVICDTSCDLPDEVLDRHGIGLVPLQLLFGDEVFQDRSGMDAAEFYQRLRRGHPHPTTSQPPPATFTAAYEHARAGAEEVVAVIVSGALSGTYASAEAARRSFAPGGVHLVDSRSASLGVGFLALRGAELAEAGWPVADIVLELGRLRGQSGVFFTVDTLDNLLRSGRVSRAKAWLGGLLDLKPILSIDSGGLITPVDRVRGRGGLLKRVLGLLDEALPSRRERLRMGVVHADVPEVAEEVREALARRYHPYEIVVSPLTAVLAAHTGPGAWGVIWQVEDGAPARAGNKTAGGAL